MSEMGDGMSQAEDAAIKHLNEMVEKLKSMGYRAEYGVYVYPDESRVKISIGIYRVLSEERVRDECMGKRGMELNECIQRAVDEFNFCNALPVVEILHHLVHVDSDTITCNVPRLLKYGSCEAGVEMFITVFSTDPAIVERATEALARIITTLVDLHRWYHEGR